MLARDLKKGKFNLKKIILKTAIRIEKTQSSNRTLWINNWKYPDGKNVEYELKLTRKYNYLKNITSTMNDNKLYNEKVLEFFEYKKKNMETIIK